MSTKRVKQLIVIGFILIIVSTITISYNLSLSKQCSNVQYKWVADQVSTVMDAKQGIYYTQSLAEDTYLCRIKKQRPTYAPHLLTNLGYDYDGFLDLVEEAMSDNILTYGEYRILFNFVVDSKAEYEENTENSIRDSYKKNIKNNLKGD